MSDATGQIEGGSIWQDPVSRFALLAVGAAVLIRLIFIGLVDLLPEEAYYWNYAAHLDAGYLDHPPMVAWLQWLTMHVFGRSEFAVRFPAFVCWLVFAWFMYRLTREIAGTRAVAPTLLLIAVLPIYWSVGFLQTPDAPLYACWAAGLYYFHRVLVRRSNAAWLGVGLAVGLGLLSKYTTGLLVGAALVFILLDKNSRRLVLTPGPYLAALLAVVIFSPVLYWNANNHWASFAFQGSRRWSMATHFNLHVLIGSALVLLTPVGFVDAIRVIARNIRRGLTAWRTRIAVDRDRLFALVFCLAPLLVFVVHSISNQTKLNWTGPVWLSILPLVALRMLRPGEKRTAPARLAPAWTVTFAVLICLYPIGLGWMALGGPGMPESEWKALPVAWEEFGAEVEEIEESLEQSSGVEPLIAGTDKYWIASQLSFYHDGTDDRDSLPEFAGSGILHRNDLMWSRWMPRASARGREVLLVGFDQHAIDDGDVAPYFASLTPVRRQPIEQRGREVGAFYWRVGSGYIPAN